MKRTAPRREALWRVRNLAIESWDGEWVVVSPGAEDSRVHVALHRNEVKEVLRREPEARERLLGPSWPLQTVKHVLNTC